MYKASDEEIASLEEELPFLDFGMFPGYLAVVASAIDRYGPQGDPDPVAGQALNVIEEIGEAVEELEKLGYKFAGSVRRSRGFARRAGSTEEVGAELADVIISAMIMLERLDLKAEDVITAKLKKIVTRGFNNH